MKGTVKFYNRIKRFGFITGEDGTDYFVHESAIKEGVSLEEGTRVTFTPTEGDRGKKAEKVDYEGDSEEADKEDTEDTEDTED
ncbi:cold shock domain-containing protein [Candidatus Woesearchaeota archaeon]|nr:cold shock domain-containing protein [Candidatus Woesearchaeota archaeon]